MVTNRGTIRRTHRPSMSSYNTEEMRLHIEIKVLFLSPRNSPHKKLQEAAQKKDIELESKDEKVSAISINRPSFNRVQD